MFFWVLQEVKVRGHARLYSLSKQCMCVMDGWWWLWYHRCVVNILFLRWSMISWCNLGGWTRLFFLRLFFCSFTPLFFLLSIILLYRIMIMYKDFVTLFFATFVSCFIALLDHANGLERKSRLQLARSLNIHIAILLIQNMKLVHKNMWNVKSFSVKICEMSRVSP